MGDYLIRLLTNQDPEFYPLLGPFLGSRQVAKDLGIPAWDDPGKVWYVAVDASGAVRGFVAALPGERGVTFCSDYVVPECRENGLYADLFATRMADYAEQPVITATVAPAAVEVYQLHGFVPQGARGKYTTMRRTRA